MTAGSEKLSHAPRNWQVWSRRRNDWALRAYDRFMASLSEETRGRFPNGDENGEAYVVVYGTTQVGKTTLLLDLMGVAAEKFHKVAKVLRGERDQGQSATATAMEYRQSPDECWQLNDVGPTVSFDNADAMEKALAELRARMSRREIRAEKPVVVGIPQSCFSNGKSFAPRVRMLDLPGANAAEAAEREHVDAIAKRYVPHADLILLVGRGDDLSFLCPDALALPGIEDWQSVPSRFRIVTTYSYTPKSLREEAKRHPGALDVTFFRQRLLDQIKTFDYRLSPDCWKLDLYFPLEIGNSWLQAQQNDDELVDQVGPIIAALKEQLHAEISKSVSKMARLKNAFEVYVVVDRLKAERLSKMKEELTQLEEGRGRINIHFDRAERTLELARSEMQEEEKYLESLPMEEVLLDVERIKTIDIEDQLSRVNSLDTNVGALRGLIADFASELTRRSLSWLPPGDEECKKRFWRSVNSRIESHRAEVTSRIGKEFAGLQRHLDSHWIDEYYPSLSDDFASDKNGLRRDMRDSARAVGEYMYALWDSRAKARKTELDAHLVALRATVEALEQALNREQIGLAGKDAEIENQKRLLAAFSQKMDVDMENGKKFHRFLDEEYLSELKMRRAVRQQKMGTSASFLSLLAAYELIEIRNKLLLGVYENAT